MSVTGVINPELIQQFSDSFDEITDESGRLYSCGQQVAWMLALAGGDTPGLLKSINVNATVSHSLYGGEIPAKLRNFFRVRLCYCRCCCPSSGSSSVKCRSSGIFTAMQAGNRFSL